MNIGLFFGSFNPIHSAHIQVAEYILENTPIKQIWFVVSPQNPFKIDLGLLDYKHRLKMVRLATKDNRSFKVSAVESKLPTPSYTINTLVFLKHQFPQHSFSLIMGSDIMTSFDKWKNYKRILDEYTLYVYKRKGSVSKLKGENIIYLNSPVINISSTEIRKMIALHKRVKDYLPGAVNKYITLKRLYQNDTA